MSAGRRLRIGLLASHPVQYYAPLYRELARHVDLHVFFAHRQSAQAQADAGFGVAFEWDVDLFGGYPHSFLDNRAARPGTNSFNGCDTPEIAAKIRDGCFDAFLVMGWYLKSHWQAVFACRRAGVPVLVRGDSHLIGQRGRLKRWLKACLYPLLLRQFDGFLYVGQRNREYLMHYGVPASRLFFSPHCVDNEAFAAPARALKRTAVRAALGLPDSARVVLFVGKLVPGKRPGDLVAALARLRAEGQDARAVFVGDGPLRESLAEAAAAADVPSLFLGFRNQKQLPACYLIADVLALPSASESWGLVVNEAIACGTPVVVSDVAGCVPDLVTPGVTGAHHPVGDIRRLAEALRVALAIPNGESVLLARAEAYSLSAASIGIVRACHVLRRK